MGRCSFPGRTMFVPGQDDNVSSQGRYLFPGGTIRSGWEISHRRRCGFLGRTILRDEVTSREAAPRFHSWEPPRAISSRAGRYRRGGVAIGRVISFAFPTGRYGDPCRSRFLEEDYMGRAPRRATTAHLLSVEISNSGEGCWGTCKTGRNLECRVLITEAQEDCGRGVAPYGTQVREMRPSAWVPLFHRSELEV